MMQADLSEAQTFSASEQSERVHLPDGGTLGFHSVTQNYIYFGPDKLLAAFFGRSNSSEHQEQKKSLYNKLKTKQPLAPIRIILSGSFCAGKTTLGKMLDQDLGVAKLIDDSTRAMRPGERQDFPYHFISPEEFNLRRISDYYFEAIDFSNASYGVPRDKLQEQRWSIDLKPSSFAYFKKNIPDIVGFYLEAPAPEELIRRARLRGDSEESIALRLTLAQEDSADGFDVILGPDLSLEEKISQIKESLFARLSK